MSQRFPVGMLPVHNRPHDPLTIIGIVLFQDAADILPAPGVGCSRVQSVYPDRIGAACEPLHQRRHIRGMGDHRTDEGTGRDTGLPHADQRRNPPVRGDGLLSPARNGPTYRRRPAPLRRYFPLSPVNYFDPSALP